MANADRGNEEHYHIFINESVFFESGAMWIVFEHLYFIQIK